MATNSIIQSLWIGNELSPMEILCIQSYLFQGHQFHLYVYDEVGHIPKGTTVKDANLIVPRYRLFKDNFNGYVNFSNFFRYTLLYELGGWWVDMDTVCLKPFDFPDDFVFSSERSEPYKRCLVNTTYIKSSPKARFLQDCLIFWEKRGYENLHWGELGVNLISRMIFRNRLNAFIKSPNVFCPISGYQLNHLVQKSDYQFSPDTYAVHWWHELWRKKQLDKSGKFPADCLYELLKKRYLPDYEIQDKNI